MLCSEDKKITIWSAKKTTGFNACHSMLQPLIDFCPEGSGSKCFIDSKNWRLGLFMTSGLLLCFSPLLSPAGHLQNCNFRFHSSKHPMSPSQQLLLWMFYHVFFLLLFFQAIHAELSKLLKRQSGGEETQEFRAKPAELMGDNIAPFLVPSKKKPSVGNNTVL